MVNFFHPSAKLIKKTRIGSKVKKIYDAPQTPYQRVLAADGIPDKEKNRLKGKGIRSAGIHHAPAAVEKNTKNAAEDDDFDNSILIFSAPNLTIYNTIAEDE